MYKHIVRFRDDAIYSSGCFIVNFMNASSAVNYLYVHTVDGGVEAILFAVKRLTTAVCVSCRKMHRKVLHVYMFVLHFNNAAKIGILHMS